MNYIKIQKKFTAAIISGIFTGKKKKVYKDDGKTVDKEVDEIIEAYVKPEEEVMVCDYVIDKLKKLGEGYEVISETKTKPGDDRTKPLP